MSLMSDACKQYRETVGDIAQALIEFCAEGAGVGSGTSMSRVRRKMKVPVRDASSQKNLMHSNFAYRKLGKNRNARRASRSISWSRK